MGGEEGKVEEGQVGECIYIYLFIYLFLLTCGEGKVLPLFPPSLFSLPSSSSPSSKTTFPGADALDVGGIQNDSGVREKR